ncbi:hypothetical protein [Streptomyces sp. NPDC001205]
MTKKLEVVLHNSSLRRIGCRLMKTIPSVSSARSGLRSSAV